MSSAHSPHSPGPPAAPEDDAILRALRNGDEQVFAEVTARWSGIMLRLALTHVANRAIAEEVVQDAWLTMLRSLDRFEGRSSLRTWVLGIVVNPARARARRERRARPLPCADDEYAVEPSRFLPATLSASTITRRRRDGESACPACRRAQRSFRARRRDVL